MRRSSTTTTPLEQVCSEVTYSNLKLVQKTRPEQFAHLFFVACLSHVLLVRLVCCGLRMLCVCVCMFVFANYILCPLYNICKCCRHHEHSGFGAHIQQSKKALNYPSIVHVQKTAVAVEALFHSHYSAFTGRCVCVCVCFIEIRVKTRQTQCTRKHIHTQR